MIEEHKVVEHALIPADFRKRSSNLISCDPNQVRHCVCGTRFYVESDDEAQREFSKHVAEVNAPCRGREVYERLARWSTSGRGFEAYYTVPLRDVRDLVAYIKDLKEIRGL